MKILGTGLAVSPAVEVVNGVTVVSIRLLQVNVKVPSPRQVIIP